MLNWLVLLRYSLIALAAGLVIFASYSFFRKPSPEEKLAALQKEVAPTGGVVFQTELQGKKTAFLLMKCEVFLLDATAKKVKRTKVLRTGFYFWLTSCTGQSIEARDGYVIAFLSNQAIGAGGGNTSGGTYRSKDGVKWQKETPKGWLDVDEAQI